MKWILYIILLTCMVSLVNAQSLDVSKNQTYTSNSDTTSNIDGTKTATLYGGVRNVYEDGDWKRIENANSLDAIFSMKVNLDIRYPVTINDFNLTSVDICLKKNTADFIIPLKTFHYERIDTETYIIENQKEVEDCYDLTGNISLCVPSIKKVIDSNINVSMGLSASNCRVISVNNIYTANLEWGFNSTIISLGTTSGDGFVGMSGLWGTWESGHVASEGVGVAYTEKYTVAESNPWICCGDAWWGLNLHRTFFPVDTSSVPDNAKIESAVFNFYVNLSIDSSNYSLVINTNQADVSEVILDDYDQCGNNITAPIEGAKQIHISSVGWYNFTLNQTGLDSINITGTTRLGLRERVYDWTGLDPEYSGDYEIQILTSENITGVPFLNITYMTVPSVNLISPIDKNNSLDYTNVDFNCSGNSTSSTLSNFSFYADYNDTWQLIEVQDSGTSFNSSVFSRNILEDIGGNYHLDKGGFRWNCLVYDSDNEFNWANSNSTFSNWDLNSTYDGTITDNQNITVNLCGEDTNNDDGTCSIIIFDMGLDGDIYRVGEDVIDWDNAHDNETGTSTDNYTTLNNVQASFNSGTFKYSINRAFLPFNTSSLPNDIIIQNASVHIRVTTTSGTDKYKIIKTTQNNPNELSEGDFNETGSTDHPIGGSEALTIGTTGWKKFNLNDTGIGWINVTNFTQLGIRILWDYNDTVVPSGGSHRIIFDSTRGTNPPYINVTYKPQDTTGTYTSKSFTNGSSVSWNNISWINISLGTSNITIQTRTTDTAGCLGGWGSWSSSHSNPSEPISSSALCLQYKATFNNVGGYRSYLQEVNISYGISILNNPPIMNTTILNSTTNDTSVDLQGFCNATDADGENVSYFWQWYKDDVLYSYGSLSNYTGELIQINQFSNSSLDGIDSVFVSDGHAFIASSYNDSLTIINITDTPTQVGYFANSTSMEFANSVYKFNDYAYITASSNDSLIIIDISDKTAPFQVGWIANSSSMEGATDVFISEDFAYVGSVTNDSLTIINVSNKTSPTQIGYLNGDYLDGIYSVKVLRDYAYITSINNKSLIILNISDKTSPSQLSYYSNTSSLDGVISVFVIGDYAYLASTTNDSLTIVDISDKTAPFQVGWIANSSSMDSAISVFTSGDYAFVGANINDSLTIIDISDKTAPSQVSWIANSSSLNGLTSIYVSGDYVYATSFLSDSLTIIDIADGFPQGVEINVANISSNELTAGENWILSCRAYDNYDFSDWLNSSVVTIISADTCSCPGSGDWVVDCSDNCLVDSACNIIGNDLYLLGIGSFNILTDVFADSIYKEDTCSIYVEDTKVFFIIG